MVGKRFRKPWGPQGSAFDSSTFRQWNVPAQRRAARLESESGACKARVRSLHVPPMESTAEGRQAAWNAVVAPWARCSIHLLSANGPVL